MPVSVRRVGGPDTRPASQDGEGHAGGSAWGTTSRMTVLVYGESRTGKTTFWSTFPGPILALVRSGSDEPGEMKSIDTPENRRKIRAEVITSSSQIRGLLAQAKAFKTVVFDHLTGYEDLALCEVLGLDELPASKGWGTVTREQYQPRAQMCKDVVRAMLNLPGNVVFVAQEKHKPTPDGVPADVIKHAIIPALGDSLNEFIRPAVDFVAQMFVRGETREETQDVEGEKVVTIARTGKVQHCMRVGPSDYFRTGARSPHWHKFPEYVVNPTYEKLARLERTGKL